MKSSEDMVILSFTETHWCACGRIEPERRLELISVSCRDTRLRGEPLRRGPRDQTPIRADGNDAAGEALCDPSDEVCVSSARSQFNCNLTFVCKTCSWDTTNQDSLEPELTSLRTEIGLNCALK